MGNAEAIVKAKQANAAKAKQANAAKPTQTKNRGGYYETKDPQILANRKASDDKMKANKDRIAKETSAKTKASQAKDYAENTAKYNKAKAISTSKDKAVDKVTRGSHTDRDFANTELKKLTDSGYKPATKPATKPVAKPATKPVAKPAAKTNSYDAANKGGAMDKLVKARNSAAKGSREYAAAQNQINSAMGSKVRHAAKKIKSVSTLKPAEGKKAEITVSTPAKMKKKC